MTGQRRVCGDRYRSGVTATVQAHRAKWAGLSVIAALSFAAGGCAGADIDPSSVAVPPSSDSRPTAPPESPSASPTATPVLPAPPESGLVVSAGPVEAALGHRAVVLRLTNLDDVTRQVEGYPDVTLLDPALAPLELTVTRGSSYMAIDPGPAPLSVEPGASVLAVVSWAGTVTDGDIVTGAYLDVMPVPGGASQIVPADVDLGTTGEVDLTAWHAQIVQ